MATQEATADNLSCILLGSSLRARVMDSHFRTWSPAPDLRGAFQAPLTAYHAVVFPHTLP